MGINGVEYVYRVFLEGLEPFRLRAGVDGTNLELIRRELPPLAFLAAPPLHSPVP
jgi:hypothetical protein